MHPIVFQVCLVALIFFLGAVALLVVRAPSRTLRILALDTLTVILIGLLVLFAIGQESALYLDAALALTLLGFAATLAAIRYRLGKVPS